MSSTSGVDLDDECLAIFQELKLKKTYKYILYMLDANNKSIVSDKAKKTEELKEMGEEAIYEQFKNELLESGPRYAVYDLAYEKPGEGQRNKILFFSWTPDDSAVKEKMLYASSKDAIRKRLVGIGVEIQGTDETEISYETVLEKVSRSN